MLSPRPRLIRVELLGMFTSVTSSMKPAGCPAQSQGDYLLLCPPPWTLLRGLHNPVLCESQLSLCRETLSHKTGRISLSCQSPRWAEWHSVGRVALRWLSKDAWPENESIEIPPNARPPGRAPYVSTGLPIGLVTYKRDPHTPCAPRHAGQGGELAPGPSSREQPPGKSG